MRRTVLTVIAVIVVAGGGVARAHHSYAEFLDQPITVDATVERIEFTSPHTLLTVRTADDRVHTIIWNAAFQLQSHGVHSTDLKVGDVIELTGYPSRDADMRQMARMRKVRRTSDGWTWQILQGQAKVGVTR